jgi:hypothetical protein
MGDQELGSVMLPSSLFLKGQNARKQPIEISRLIYEKRRKHGNGNATNETINPFSERRFARTVSSIEGTCETCSTLARPDSSTLWLFHGRARHDHRHYCHTKKHTLT